MHKIAIIMSAGGDDYYCDRQFIQSITDWVDVPDDVFTKLSAAQYIYGYTVVERPTDPQAWINRTVQQWSDFLDERATKEAADAQERREKLERTRLNKLAKNRDDKLRLLEKLKEELGEV